MKNVVQAPPPARAALHHQLASARHHTLSPSHRISAKRLTSVAACLLLMLVCAVPAHGQTPISVFDWLRPVFMSDWLTRYWADDAQEDGTRLATLPDPPHKRR